MWYFVVDRCALGTFFVVQELATHLVAYVMNDRVLVIGIVRAETIVNGRPGGKVQCLSLSKDEVSLEWYHNR